MDSTAYLSAVITTFAAHANPENALPMARYMKNHFAFFGIKKPERVLLSKKVIRELGILPAEELPKLCQACFQQPQRELQYFVYDLLASRMKELPVNFLDTIEALIQQKSWWDTVDFLAPKIGGKLLLRFPEAIVPRTQPWIESDNIWLQRSAILFQLDYKSKTDAELLFRYIRRRADSKEFFVQKAAGWALREYGKTNPEAVQQFISTNTLAKLTVREGMKRIVQK